jgi:hypothetical protein
MSHVRVAAIALRDSRRAAHWMRAAALWTVVVLVAFNSGISAGAPPPGFNEKTGVWPTSVTAASCRRGDRVETGLQGEVTLEDRASGRSTAGYACNIDLVGQYQGQGANFISASYKTCTYVGSTFPHSDGVHVIDASDISHPQMTANLSEPAMVGGTWESLKVNQTRGLLAATGVPFYTGFGYFSIYDVSQDCAHPRLLNLGRGSVPGMRIGMLTHEGAFSPDGNTYWSSGSMWVTALDVSDPSDPHSVWSAPAGLGTHGMGFTPDGDTMYMSTLAGVNILDTSAIQDRAQPGFTMHQMLPLRGDKHWADGEFTQHSVYVTYGGVPHIFTVDESGSGGVKLFDAADPANLLLRNDIKLSINLPEHQDRWWSSAINDGFFGYDPHYCSVDRQDNPLALACGWQQSGVRVFDVRDPEHIREIAYYNPPAQTGKQAELTNSVHAVFGKLAAAPLSGTLAVARAILQGDTRPDGSITAARNGQHVGNDLSADWCMSPPEFRGNMLYVTCSDNGFMELVLDPRVYPPR